MLFNRPVVVVVGRPLHSSCRMLIPAVRVVISARDIDWTCFVSDVFFKQLLLFVLF